VITRRAATVRFVASSSGDPRPLRVGGALQPATGADERLPVAGEVRGPRLERGRQRQVPQGETGLCGEVAEQAALGPGR
jgi:hypothetical protein